MLYFPGANHLGKYFPIHMCKTSKLIFQSKADIFTFMIAIYVWAL